MSDSHLPSILSELIPKQTLGMHCDTLAVLECMDKMEANLKYQFIKKRFLGINAWNKYTGETKALFNLADQQGQFIERIPQNGDLIQVKISSLLSLVQRTEEWVKLEDVKVNDTSENKFVVLQLRPCTCPHKNGKGTDHFFDSKASNTLILFLKEHTIYISIHGRNEKPNFNTDSKLKILRNIFLANLGFMGFSKLQWQSLADGLINDKDTDDE